MNRVAKAIRPYRLRAVMAFARLLGVPVDVRSEWFLSQLQDQG